MLKLKYNHDNDGKMMDSLEIVEDGVCVKHFGDYDGMINHNVYCIAGQGLTKAECKQSVIAQLDWLIKELQEFQTRIRENTETIEFNSNEIVEINNIICYNMIKLKGENDGTET